ncbi:hypothetical protein [Sphingomonas koreensis]|uniref:hypothetical protein n=1 Tax=Sphingomonas koreensis TaxID=93064 RepID=UPI0009FA7575|nr:hypothetical protein [Sphingomonas koreensis]MDC7810349.1 hypothetical protein [Sphingomonas koreensis]
MKNDNPLRTVWITALVSFVSLAATAAIGSETVTYTYDARGRLTKVEHSEAVNNGVDTNYVIDKAGNRVKVKTTGAP